MKLYLYIIFFTISIPLFGREASPEVDSPVTGYLDITVESNVNKVNFSYPISERNLTAGNSAKMRTIIVPVKDFRCDNKIAFRDFLTLLQAEKYPELTIEIPDRVLQQLSHEDEVELKDVTINIAGVSKEYNIICTAENSPEGDRILAGTIKIDLNDYDIRPPVKYFGMVKIRDEVIVKFGLGVRDRNFAHK